MPQDRLTVLFNRYLSKTYTAAEKEELAELIMAAREDGALSSLLEAAWLNANAETDLSEEKATAIVTAILQQQNKPMIAARVSSLRKWWWAAAVVILFTATGAYLWTIQKSSAPTVTKTTPPAPADLPPGYDGAILTLHDGRKIVLDSLGNGIVAIQNGTEISLNDGQLAYNANNAAAISYNTMTTPRGRQFHLLLPDGSHVWLNAASSISFPTSFKGTTRAVSITGEAYFEVAKNSSQPFTVSINEQTQIEVLGTHFNINSYKNEQAVKTTLLEGSVRVKAQQEQATLKPGQQAQVIPAEKIKVINEADINQAMAWKHGYFNFNSADLPAVMRQLERWYDIDVKYTGPIQPRSFRGKLNRNLSLLEILKILDDMNVKYSLQGKTLIIQ